ncbi:hypothetical protein L2E82_19538 [Cichorium intybus]|uniref:Uncharacterized protein n=1 Tax=Cichorium intybus TaxID=13427 RepID=A0ACB9FD41_CICIN|nr:hypothetical protein L2E82_19538 [Cichorium intybus]
METLPHYRNVSSRVSDKFPTSFGISICKKSTAADKFNMKKLEDAYEEKKAESQAKDVELPCEAGVGFKKRKGDEKFSLFTSKIL